MIPSAILAGLIVGRWWSIPLIGALWAAFVSFDLGAPVLQAFALGTLNAAVGVAVHQLVRTLLDRRKPRSL